jgi:hypothetical protein
MSTKSISYYYKAARFIARKHLRGYSISQDPSFDAGGMKLFDSVISNTKVYLEYGSGGSTFVAAKSVAVLVSVESDCVFKTAVERALPQSRAEIHMVSPNIGTTIDWGTPVFTRPTAARVNRWKRYPQAPWAILASKMPDTILVDGRLRVACTLESLLHVDRATIILVDDYADRNYRAIEQFADLTSLGGRMAEFRKKTDFDKIACKKALEIAYSDLS